MSKQRRVIYEGKAKILYEGPEPHTIIQYFKDDMTAFNREKFAIMEGKGVLNNRISEYIMLFLQAMGVQTHFIQRLNMREQLVHEVDVIPLEVVVRNIAAGTLSKRLAIPEGENFDQPILELYYKDDTLGDPLVNDDHAITFGWVDSLELDEIKETALRINDLLSGLFQGIGLKLVDFKLEFGRLVGDDLMSLVLADEISPDSCRFWDVKTGDSMDKDAFRKDLGNVVEKYAEVARRLGIVIEQETQDENITARGENITAFPRRDTSKTPPKKK